MSIPYLTLILSAYLLGSLSSAIIIAKLAGLPDPRNQGSNNPGATNMVRLYGKKIGILTLIGDMIKGVIPVLIAHMYASGNPQIIILSGFAAFLGHLYPIFFQFRGGKGVATALGVLLAAYWPLGLFTCLVWISMFFITRISSASALIAFILTPLFAYFMQYPPVVVYTVLTMSLILSWRHRSNIRNLLEGTEGKPSKQNRS